MLGKPLPLATLLVCLAASAEATPYQHGNIVVDVPPGWDVYHNDPSFLVLRYEDHYECGACLFKIGPSAPARGSLEAWLEAQIESHFDISDRDPILDIKDYPSKVGDFEELTRVINTQGYLYTITAFRAGDTFESTSFQGYAGTEQHYEWMMEVLETDVAAIEASLRYTHGGAGAVMPQAEPGNLSGVYWGSVMMPSLVPGSSPSMTYKGLVFYPDGYFIEGAPPNGIEDVDMEALEESLSWGVYRESGGKVDLTFVDGRTEVMTAEDGGWAYAGVILRPVTPLTNARLNGSGKKRDNTTVSMGSGGSASSSSVTCRWFRSDGTFEEATSGLVSGTASAPSGVSTPFTDSFGGRSGGTYEIRDGVIILDFYGSAPTVTELAFVSPDKILFLGDYMFNSGSDPDCPRESGNEIVDATAGAGLPDVKKREVVITDPVLKKYIDEYVRETISGWSPSQQHEPAQ